MTSEEYGQYIDDFELGADVMPGESLTEYIERRRREFESKADGGSIGIEVLFRDKKADGGRVPMVSGGALKGLMSLFKGGDKAADLAKQEEIFRTGPITTKFLEDVDDKLITKFVRTRDTKGPGSYGMYDSFDDMPAGLKAAELISRIRKKGGGIDYEKAEFFLGTKLKGNESVDELIDIMLTKGSIKSDFADGGRVGLFMGGPPLEGQALSIYNSMSAYGFSDQAIANALQEQGLYTPAGSGSGTETTQPNIIGAQLNQGDDRVTELQETFTKDLSGDPRFNYLTPQEQSVKYRFDRSVDPREGLMGFFDKIGNKFKESKFFQPKIRGTLGTRLANQPKLPIPSFASFLSNYTSPFNIKSKSYNPLLEEQLNFAETQEGIIGRDPNSGLLKYGPESVLAGKNVISMFGTNDYEKMLQDYITKMNANKRISATTKAAKLAQAQKELEELQKKTEAARAAQYGAIDYGRGSDGQRSYSGDAIGAPGLGFGVGATTGGPVSNRTGRGRQDYSKGGLATMFTRRR